MQVAAEIAGISHLVDVAAAAVMGSNVSADHEILVKNRLMQESHIKYFQAKSEGRVFACTGPAGSGKTETIKDIERALGVDPVVVNCTPGDASVTDTLSSLPQGSVVILDDFNCLSVPEMANVFQLQVERSLMLSITYNPGYAGRTQIPPELKARCIFQEMIRPTDDPELNLGLLRALLARFGFLKSEELGPKLSSLLAAMQDQCKKRHHYDFGLRFLMSVMRQAGKLLALDPSLDETELLALSVLKPMWMKADDADRGIVLSLMGDLMGYTPTVPASWTVSGPQSSAAMVGSMFESRHGGMLLVDRGGQMVDTITALRAEATARQAKLVVVAYDGPGWEERFSDAFCEASASHHPVWLVTDMSDLPWIEDWGFSPHPAFWENLNSLLDDNKVLTLRDGQTLPLHPDMRVLFVAPPSVPTNMSPAAVSRLGFVDATKIETPTGG